MKYSICSTVYNGAGRINKSLESILKYINFQEFEIVIVDSESTDGTKEILKKYASNYPNFKVIEKKCTRGMGRQIAFAKSKGEYIITVDLDTIYYSQWWELISTYERWEHRGKYALQAVYSGIYPRRLLEIVGGWRDLQWGEDFDLWWRLIEINVFKWTPLITGENWQTKEKEKRQEKNMFKVVSRKFINERDRFISRSEYTLRARLREIHEWSRGINYYLFWVPLVSLAKFNSYLKGAIKRDPELVIEKWERNMVDFEIHGKRDYNFITFPK